MKFKIGTLFTLLLLFFSSIIASIILFFDPLLPTNRSFLPLLPLFFSFGCILFMKTYFYIYRSLSIFIIVITYFIRMVVTPYFMKFSFYQRSGVVADINNTFDLAVVLMIYEFLLVFCVISIFVNKFFTRDKIQIKMEMNFFKTQYKTPKVILYLLTLFILISIVMFPEILNNYKFFVFFSEEQSIDWYRNYNNAKQSVPLIIFYTSTWAINILKNIWVLVLILEIRKRGAKKVNILISVFIIMLNSFISSGDTAYSMYFSLALCIVLANLYSNSKKLILSSTAILIGAGVLIGLLSFSFSSSGRSSSMLFNISNTLQAYFNGPVNIAVSLLIDEASTLSLIIGDFFTSLPLLRTFFIDMPTSSGIFNEVMFNFNGGGQIIPSVGLGKIYFGFILAPIFSCLFAYFSLRYEFKNSQETRLHYSFLYQFISIVLACMPVLYNYYIFLIGLFTYILPTWILIIFIAKKIQKT